MYDKKAVIAMQHNMELRYTWVVVLLKNNKDTLLGNMTKNSDGVVVYGLEPSELERLITDLTRFKLDITLLVESDNYPAMGKISRNSETKVQALDLSLQHLIIRGISE